MSGLGHLTAKILDEAKKRAEQITASAQAQAKSLVEDAVAGATREQERILADAKAEAKQAAEQVTLGKTLAIRDQNLEAKQKALETVFSAALEQLNTMPDDTYKKFLLTYLRQIDLSGQEIILPKNRAITIEELNLSLGGASLKPSAQEREIGGGFVLCKDGIEQNYTFEALVSYHRYDLESEVLGLLY